MFCELTDWERSRLGTDAERIRYEVCLAIRDAQADAVQAQAAQSSPSLDAYGHTLYPAQHEMLIRRLGALPGIVLRKPSGVRSRFELAVVEETNAVLVPVRFSNDPRVRHDRARLELSELRLTLFDLRPQPPEDVLPFDEDVDPEEAQRKYQEDLAAFEELQKLGNAVVVGFGSTPDGVFELGWGCVDVIDQGRGVVDWHPWVALPILDVDGSAPEAPPLRLVPDLDETVKRFDHDDSDDTGGARYAGEASDADDLGLRPRPRPIEAPSSEGEENARSQSTGTADSEGE